MTNHWSHTAILLAITLCTIALLASLASQPISAEAAAPAETLTMSSTWWSATATPLVPSVTFAPTATDPVQPTATVLVADPIIMAYEVFLPEVRK